MTASKPIPVKLSEGLVQRLDRVSEKTGLGNRSALIRLCLRSFLDYYEKKGKVSLPVNWREILEWEDGRGRDGAGRPELKAADPPGSYGTKKKRKS
ncbi:MAG: ribbon-helix-helix domain-containing protein [Kiritimatiellia bacterium]